MQTVRSLPNCTRPLCAQLQSTKASAGSRMSGRCIGKVDMADLFSFPESPLSEKLHRNLTFKARQALMAEPANKAAVHGARLA